MWIPRKRLHKILIAASIIFIVFSLIPFIREPIGWIRLWEFARQQLAFLLFLCLVFWFLLKHREPWEYILILGCFLLMVYHLTKLVPYHSIWQKEVPYTEEHQQDPQNRVSILMFNVYIENEETEKFLDLAFEVDSDLILLTEPNEFWAREMQPLHEHYPYRVSIPKDNTYGMILYSKLPLQNEEIKFIIEEDVPSIHAYIELPSGNRFRFYGLHPRPPTPTKNADKRDAEIMLVANDIVERAKPAIIAADINDVMWSKSMRVFLNVSGMNDPRKGRKIKNTFNAKIPFIRWPLDYFFVSDHWAIDRFERLEAIGSDHFPVFMETTMIQHPDVPHLPDDYNPNDTEFKEDRIERGTGN